MQISTTQLDQTYFNPNLRNGDEIDMSPFLRIPAEIGDNWRTIATAMRFKTQEYTRKSQFYVFFFNLMSRNRFNNPEYITMLQQAIDGAAYVPMVGAMLTTQGMLEAVDKAFTGAVARVISQYQQEPTLANDIRQIVGAPNWAACVDTYNRYVEENINAFLRLKQQRMQQQQQPPGYGLMPQGNVGYAQPGMVSVGGGYPQQPQGYAQPQMAAQVTNAQATVPSAQPQNMYAQQHASPATGDMLSQYDMMESTQPAAPQSNTGDYVPYEMAQPIPSVDPRPSVQTEQPAIVEISNDGVKYEEQPKAQPLHHQIQRSTYEPPVQQDDFEDVFDEPVPNTLDDVCFEPGKYGTVAYPNRPYSDFYTNGGVHVLSHREAVRKRAYLQNGVMYDMMNEVGFLAIWPNGRMEFKVMPVSDSTEYLANEMLESNLLFTGDRVSAAAKALQERKGEGNARKRPKEYRDLTSKELKDHKALDVDTVIDGFTDEERDAIARQTVIERDGACTGVVSYHNVTTVPLVTTPEGATYLQLSVAESQSLVGLAKALKRQVNDESIAPETFNLINNRMTRAINGFLRTEVNECIMIDNFVEDIVELMDELYETDEALAEYIEQYSETLINRILTIRTDSSDEEESADTAYIEDDQLNLLLPIHSMNFTQVRMTPSFGVRFDGRSHNNVFKLIREHLTETKASRIRLVTVDGFELWATAGMGNSVMLTIDPEHV